MSPRLPPSVTGSIQKLIDEAKIIMAHGIAQLIFQIEINNKTNYKSFSRITCGYNAADLFSRKI